MLWILGAAALALALLLVERLLVAPEDQLTAEDVLALPHSKVRLTARLERYLIRFVDPPVRGETVEFFEGETRLGSAVTDARGFASIEIDAGPEGRRRLRVATRRADEALVVDVLPGDAPILILDLDHTLSDIGTTRFAFAANKTIRPLDGAIDAAKRLAGRYRIAYLTARDHSFLGKTREWLRMQGLADGPVFLRRRRFWSQASLDHKMERLGELKKTHRLVAGVGDLPTDAKAYLANGLAAYLIDPSGALPEIEGTVRARTWKELEERLMA
ncbi:MAG TPA: hypothetical protein VJU16_05615 [Planctomycetota bacterium]|nr:hypothetical protein [Planctomycetota bacterium]